MTAPLLEVRDLTHVYATGTRALTGVSFALARGERVGLVGPNGAGKSSLLLHMAGVLPSAHGVLLLDGAIVDPKNQGTLHQQVGLVFQHADDMLFTTSVHDDVAFGPRQLKLAADVVGERVQRALDQVAISHLADRVPHHLSAGEKRSVAIAAVLAMEPEVLLLDEPTSDLDPRGRRALLKLLDGLGKTLLVASHDLEFVLGLCDRVLVLDGGRVVTDGPAREILGDEPLMLEHGLERPHSLTPHTGHSHEHGH